ncbi:MAG: DUF4397 domain-containing protein [Acidimicrobiales bacterium]
MFRRISQLAMGAALVGATVVVPLATSQAAGTSKVNVVHGVKPISGDAPVDVYAGPANATSWNLAKANLLYGQTADLGDLAAGDINVLICSHSAANPAATITACSDNGGSAVNGNSGTNVTIPDGKNVTLVAAYSATPAQGRPSVLVFENDVSCVPDAATGRLGAAHAAYAPAVDVLVNGSVAFANVSEGGEGHKNVAAGSYNVAVNLTGTNTEVVAANGVAVAGSQLTKAFVVGSQSLDANVQFDILTYTFPLSVCSVPTTATTTTTAPPAVTPAFTG